MINVRIYSYKPLDSRLFPLVFGYQAVAQVLGSNFALWGCQIFCKPGWGEGAYSNMSWWMMMDDDGWWWIPATSPTDARFQNDCFMFVLLSTLCNINQQNATPECPGRLHWNGSANASGRQSNWSSVVVVGCRRWGRAKRAQCLVVSRHYSYKELSREILTLEQTNIHLSHGWWTESSLCG